MTESRVKFDESSSNGLLIEEKYIPEEVLSLILCYVDHKTLLACQLVCKRWKFLMQDFVWHKKAEFSIKSVIPKNEIVQPWQLYYFSCSKLFGKNLIKNHSGEMGLNAHWTVTATSGNNWAIEAPPRGVPPLPDDPVFENKVHCFVTSFHGNNYRNIRDVEDMGYQKFQIVDLVKEGFSEYLLDNFQPKITISEWVSSRWDCSAVYGCNFQLIGIKNGKKEKVFDCRKQVKQLRAEINNIYHGTNEWIKIEYTLESYGRGLRKIKFIHGGQDTRFWRGHYGCKMAGACVKVENPLIDNVD